MPFEPIPGQFYRIVAKHSGKVLEVQGNQVHRNTPIQQGDWSSGENQQFQLHREGNFYNIIARSTGRSFDVPGSSTADGLGIIQWDRHDYSPNQQFRFLPEGNGAYYISANHSEKFLAIKDGGTANATPLVQQVWNGGDQFLFTFEPIQPVVSPRSLREIVLRGADPIREAVIGLTSLIPQVGGGVKLLLGLLWKDSGGSLIDQTRDYVREVAKAMVDEQHLRDLANQIVGLKNAINQYTLSGDVNYKRTQMASLITALETSQPHYFDSDHPEKTLPHLLTLGSMHLSALRERYDHWDEWYPQSTGDKPAFEQDLNKRVDLYVNGAKDARTKTLNWRLAYIGMSQQIHYQDGRPHHDVFVVDDSYANWRYVADVGNIDRSRALGQRVLDERKRAITEEFNAELDALFGPALVWKYIKPKTTETVKTVRPTMSPMLVGIPNGTNYPGMERDLEKPINYVAVWGNERDQIYKVQIGRRNGGWYDLGPATGIGTPSHLALGDDEYVTGAYGNHDGPTGPLYSLYFVTSKGRIVGLGRRNIGTPWESEPPVGTDARLDNIYGWRNGDRIEGIGFKWGYARKE